jgi:hypothetical protein
MKYYYSCTTHIQNPNLIISILIIVYILLISFRNFSLKKLGT